MNCLALVGWISETKRGVNNESHPLKAEAKKAQAPTLKIW